MEASLRHVKLVQDHDFPVIIYYTKAVSQDKTSCPQEMHTIVSAMLIACGLDKPQHSSFPVHGCEVYRMLPALESIM